MAPSEGYQFFGKVDIAAAPRPMTVRLMNRDDTRLWSTELFPANG